MKPLIIIANFLLAQITFITGGIIIFKLMPHGPKHAVLAALGTLIIITLIIRTYRTLCPPTPAARDSIHSDTYHHCQSCHTYGYQEDYPRNRCTTCNTPTIHVQIPNT